MTELTMGRLKEIMGKCSGVDESVDISGDIGGTPFRDLGYDSLAVLEIVSQVQRDHGLSIPDEAIDEMNSPDALLSYVNSALAVA